jgi:hypothetical protein
MSIVHFRVSFTLIAATLWLLGGPFLCGIFSTSLTAAEHLSRFSTAKKIVKNIDQQD